MSDVIKFELTRLLVQWLRENNISYAVDSQYSSHDYIDVDDDFMISIGGSDENHSAVIRLELNPSDPQFLEKILHLIRIYNGQV